MEEILVLYGANVFAAIAVNTGTYYKIHRESRKESKRALTYKPYLSSEAKKEMRFHFLASAYDGIKNSFIPFKNIFYTLETIFNYDEIKETFVDEYNLIVSETDDLEHQIDEYLEKQETAKELKLKPNNKK